LSIKIKLCGSNTFKDRDSKIIYKYSGSQIKVVCLLPRRKMVNLASEAGKNQRSDRRDESNHALWINIHQQEQEEDEACGLR
jgi:hypothetical protein